VRAGLEALVRGSTALALVGSSSSVATLDEQSEDLEPDVVLMELDQHDEEQLATLSALSGRRGDSPGPAIVGLAEDPTASWAAQALRSGLSAILPRHATAAEILAAVEAASAGLIVLHPGALGSLLSEQLPPSHLVPHSPNQVLSPREIEILGMLAQGLGNKEIAWRLKISEHTVKFHISSIFTKLDVSSRTEAVTLGIRLGLVTL
jgi:NarL family two-component system response regulator YdfI